SVFGGGRLHHRPGDRRQRRHAHVAGDRSSPAGKHRGTAGLNDRFGYEAGLCYAKPVCCRMRASLAIVLLAGCGESVAPASKPAPSLDADAAPFCSDAALSPTDAALSDSDAASSDSDAAFSGPDVVSEPPFDPGPFVDLGPNDVTILVPVPEAAGSALLSGTD